MTEFSLRSIGGSLQLVGVILIFVSVYRTRRPAEPSAAVSPTRLADLIGSSLKRLCMNEQRANLSQTILHDRDPSVISLTTEPFDAPRSPGVFGYRASPGSISLPSSSANRGLGWALTRIGGGPSPTRSLSPPQHLRIPGSIRIRG